MGDGGCAANVHHFHTCGISRDERQYNIRQSPTTNENKKPTKYNGGYETKLYMPVHNIRSIPFALNTIHMVLSSRGAFHLSFLFSSPCTVYRVPSSSSSSLLLLLLIPSSFRRLMLLLCNERTENSTISRTKYIYISLWDPIGRLCVCVHYSFTQCC